MSKQPLTRRCFLKSMATVCAALSVPGSLSRVLAQGDENFYVEHRQEILNELRPFSRGLQATLTRMFEAPFGRRIVAATWEGYGELLPELPYIGGYDNILTSSLYQSAFTLPFYWAMQAEGIPVEQTGEVIYRALEFGLGMIPAAVWENERQAFASEETRRMFRQAARQSQEHEYPEDWVFEFVPGEEGEFDFGIDYTECGVCKLFNTYNSAELTPYLCLMDYPMSELTGNGLRRTGTLALGDERCDFRYLMGREIQLEWTPPFLQAEES